MDSKYEDFNDVINNVTVDMPKTKFELNQLKLEHYYLADGDVNFGMPISTSIELVSKLDYETQKNVWEKIVTHTYINLDNNKSTVFYKQNIDEKIIKQIEQYDLRELKNNYFSDSEPENFSYWSITYNRKFNIVGTYDQEISEFVGISNILDFKDIIKSEPQKIQDKIQS